MGHFDLDETVTFTISIKLLLGIIGGMLPIIGVYTKVAINIALARYKKSDSNFLALAELGHKNDLAEVKMEVEKLKSEVEEARKEGERQGHEKGYEAGKVDSTRDARHTLADLLIDEAARLRGQVRDVDKQNLPSSTDPLPNTPLPYISVVGSGMPPDTFNTLRSRLKDEYEKAQSFPKLR